MNNPDVVAIALGSNIGDRDAHLDYAVGRLSTILTEIRVSSRRDTAPVGVADDQSSFLNAAVVGTATLGPRRLLANLQGIEAERGRQRPYPNAPRTLDLDLILYGGLTISDDQLVLPHPRFRDRAFVLEPLVEIAPDLMDPVTGLTIRGLLERLRQASATDHR